MSVVAIIGAGDLGGALASRLASRNRVREVRLIDAAAGVAAGKALDILQAGPVEGSATRVTAPAATAATASSAAATPATPGATGAADLSAVAGAAVIVIADEVGPPVKEIQAEAGLALLGRVRSHNAVAPIVCAGASHAWLVAHGAAELGIPATHLVGSAPLALVAALKALVALELNGSAQDVSLTLAGQPPQAVAVPWQTASVNGESLERLLDAPALRRIESRVRYLWPPGPYALAAAAARMTEGLIAGCRQTLCGFTADAADDDRGFSRTALSTSSRTGGSPRAPARPVRIEPGPGPGRWQVRAADLPAFSSQQHVALDAIL
jgi:malate/lactate dehydrogenase